MPKPRIIIIGVIGLVIIFFALLFLGVIPGLKPKTGPNQGVKLTFWGVFDKPEILNEIFRSIPGFQITYKQFNPQTYESELVNALAAGRGPDIFMVQNSWLPKHADKLSPILRSDLQVSNLRDIFPAVVEQDFAPDENLVYALPLYLDNLALFYNQNIFDSKAIALPPANWIDFQNLIPKLREIDQSGKLVKAASAIGGSNKNISRATDLLAILMIQSGAPMVSKDFSRADFVRDGLGALQFYTKFANPGNQFYAWNDSQKNSLDNFAEENTAIIFNYAQALETLKEKNPFLKVGIAPLPQPSTSKNIVNYANYWGVAVSNRASSPASAWNFIWNLTIKEDVAKLYSEKTNRLPALRTLIAEKINDPDLGVFAKQALSSRSWPQINNLEIERIFSKMIDDVISGRQTTEKAIQEAESSITQLITRKKQGF